MMMLFRGVSGGNGSIGTRSGSQDIKGRFSVSQVKGDIQQERVCPVSGALCVLLECEACGEGRSTS